MINSTDILDYRVDKNITHHITVNVFEEATSDYISILFEIESKQTEDNKKIYIKSDLKKLTFYELWC